MTATDCLYYFFFWLQHGWIVSQGFLVNWCSLVVYFKRFFRGLSIWIWDSDYLAFVKH
jgi:hypothetical protein